MLWHLLSMKIDSSTSTIIYQYSKTMFIPEIYCDTNQLWLLFKVGVLNQVNTVSENHNQ